MSVKIKLFSLISFVCLLVATLSVGVWALTSIDEFSMQGDMSYTGVEVITPVDMSTLPLAFVDGSTTGTKLILDCIDTTITSIEIPAYVTDGSTTYKVVGTSNGASSSTGAFYGCTSLKKVVIPNTFTQLGNYTFYNCSSLANVEFEIDSQLETLGNYSIRGCTALKSIAIPDSVTSIGAYAFSGCSNLEAVHIGEKVKTINTHAFSNCSSLKSIHIPASVTGIANGAVFQSCSSLETITVDSNNTVYDSRSNSIVTTSSNTLLVGSNTTVIPNTVKIIASYAFHNRKFTEIVVPSTVTSIGQCAFQSCINLHRITLPFVGYSSSSSQYFGYIFGASSYSNNASSVPTRLKDVIITNQTAIPANAFYNCQNIINITLQARGTTFSVGANAFYNCKALAMLTLPKFTSTTASSSSVGDCFTGCTALQHIALRGSARGVSFYADFLTDCSGLLAIYATAKYSTTGITAQQTNINAKITVKSFG